MPSLKCRLKQNFIPGHVKLIEYWISAAKLWFNSFVGPLPRIKISFPLLLIWTDELISAPKIIKSLATLTSGKEYSSRVSNPIP